MTELTSNDSVSGALFGLYRGHIGDILGDIGVMEKKNESLAACKMLAFCAS